MKVEIKPPFYPLKNEEWLSIAKKLTHSELLVLYHLRTLEPFGDRMTNSSTKDVSEATSLSQRSVQRALIKLAELELIDLQIQKFSFRLRSKCATEMTGGDSAVASTSPVSPTRQECRVNVTAVALTSPLSDSSSETVTTSGFEISKTLKTYSDLLKTLSEGTRESFEKFCKRKIEECSFKIGSRTAWLNKHGKEYLQEFNELYAYAISNPEVIAPKVEIALPSIEQLKRQYGSEWESAAAHFGLVSPNSSTVEKVKHSPSASMLGQCKCSKCECEVNSSW